MPLYEYRCPRCDRRFEILQPLGAAGDDLSCPGCAAVGMKRQWSTFAASTQGAPAPAGPSPSACCGQPFT